MISAFVIVIAVSIIACILNKVVVKNVKQETAVKLSRMGERLLKFLMYGAAGVTLTLFIWLVSDILIKGVGGISWEFLSTEPFKDAGGIYPMIVTTVWLVLLSLLIATPVGICAAIYLSEYAKPSKTVEAIRFAIESLAGIPSIIYGLFGMLFFVNIMQFKYSLLSGALTVSIMVLPVVIRTTEEALKIVSDDYRAGSLALGASKIRTIVKVVLPSSISGIISGVILSIGRIFGETAAIYLTAGMVPKLPETIMASGRTLSVHLYLLAKEGTSFEMAYATATVLIVIIAIINFSANALGKFLSKKNAS